ESFDCDVRISIDVRIRLNPVNGSAPLDGKSAGGELPDISSRYYGSNRPMVRDIDVRRKSNLCHRLENRITGVYCDTADRNDCRVHCADASSSQHDGGDCAI